MLGFQGLGYRHILGTTLQPTTARSQMRGARNRETEHPRLDLLEKQWYKPPPPTTTKPKHSPSLAACQMTAPAR